MLLDSNTDVKIIGKKYNTWIYYVTHYEKIDHLGQ